MELPQKKEGLVMGKRSMGVLFGVLVVFSTSLFADETFDKLFRAGKYKEAIDYADNNIPPASRSADVWVKVAKSNEELGLVEKALACYLVSSRMNPNDYASWYGAARIYNKMGDFESGLNSAKKALEISFTGEASWEYANACIQLDRAAEAKKALEKVIESDPSNIIANRELGNIYYNDKEYAKSIPLLKKSYEKKADSDVAYKIGKAGLETNDLTTAVEYLKEASKKSVDAQLDLARTYFKQGDFSNASSAYDKAFGKTKGKPIDHYNNAVAKEKTGNEAGALKSYADAVKQYGASKDKEALTARLIVARNELSQKRYQSALGHFKFILGADPKRQIAPDIYFLLSSSYEGLKQMKSAISYLEKALAIDSKNVEAYARLADLYKRNNQEDKAKATYEKMIALSPNDPKIYLTLGDYNLKQKNYSEALKHYEKSFVLARNAKAAEGIAIAAAELGQWDKAGDAAESAVSLDASVMEPRKILYKYYIKKQQYPSAIKQLEYLVDKDGNNLEYWKNLALAYDKTGNTEKLAQADSKVISLDAKNTESRLRYAQYSMSKGDTKSAEKVYKELSILAPKNASVWKNLYLIAKKDNDKASALNYVKKYLALSPNDAEAQRDLGDYLYERKDFDGALQAYRTALKVDPEIKGFLKRYAEIVIAKGEHEEAIQALNLKVKAGNASADDYATLGMIYQKKKSYSSAITNYQKSLQLNPQNTEILAALAETQALKGDVSEAIITYEQVLMMNPKAAKEYKALGALYEKQKKTDQAMKAYKNYLDNSSGDNAIAQKVGSYLLKKKDYQGALKYMEMVSGSAANDFTFKLEMTEAAFEAGQFKKSIKLAEELLGRNPSASTYRSLSEIRAKSYENDGQLLKAADAYRSYAALKGVRDQDAAYKAASLREKSDKAGAIKIYEQNTAKYPGDFRNFLQLGLIYSEDKATLSKSVAMFKKITSMADSVPVIWEKLGQVYGKLGKPEQELDAYMNYVKHEPQNPDANKRIGIILVEQGKHKEGLIYLETASTLAPKDAEILYSLAEGYAKTNRPEESVRALEKANIAKPNDPKIVSQLYKMYLRVGRSKDAKREIEKLIAMNPNDATTRLSYAQLLFDEKKFKEAAEEIENVMATSPSTEALMLLAKVQIAEKDYEDALATYDEIIAMENFAPALYEKAELFRQYGDKLKKSPKWAETYYERALRADPNFALAKLGLARLQKLWNRDDLYKKYLEEAKAMDPTNKEIMQEYANLR